MKEKRKIDLILPAPLVRAHFVHKIFKEWLSSDNFSSNKGASVLFKPINFSEAKPFAYKWKQGFCYMYQSGFNKRSRTTRRYTHTYHMFIYKGICYRDLPLYSWDSWLCTLCKAAVFESDVRSWSPQGRQSWREDEHNMRYQA